MTTAELSQKMTALQRANEVRLERAVLKRQISAGKTSVADFLSEPIPVWAETMRLQALLQAEPKIGPKRMVRLVQEADVAPFGVSTRLNVLTGRQKRYLVELLNERSKRALTKFERGLR